jgi:hypothetical protein
MNEMVILIILPLIWGATPPLLPILLLEFRRVLHLDRPRSPARESTMDALHEYLPPFILSIVLFSFGSYLTHFLRGRNAAGDTLEHAIALGEVVAAAALS